MFDVCCSTRGPRHTDTYLLRAKAAEAYQGWSCLLTFEPVAFHRNAVARVRLAVQILGAAPTDAPVLFSFHPFSWLAAIAFSGIHSCPLQQPSPDKRSILHQVLLAGIPSVESEMKIKLFVKLPIPILLQSLTLDGVNVHVLLTPTWLTAYGLLLF